MDRTTYSALLAQLAARNGITPQELADSVKTCEADPSHTGGLEVGDIREAAAALLAHTSRTEIRQRNKLEAEFRRVTTPERVLELVLELETLREIVKG